MSGNQKLIIVQINDERFFIIVVYFIFAGIPGQKGDAGSPGTRGVRGEFFFKYVGYYFVIIRNLASLFKFAFGI